MRRLTCRVALIVLSFCLFSTTVVAVSFGQKTPKSKIYFFCEADGQDDKFGPDIKTAAENLKETLMDFVAPDRLIVYNEKDSPWRGPDFYFSDDVSRDIFVAIEECPATSEDTIFFYWSGHGAFDSFGHYLVVPSDRGPATIRRHALVNALQNKGARLTVLFTDSCNVPIDADLNFPPRPTKDRGFFLPLPERPSVLLGEKLSYPWLLASGTPGPNSPLIKSLFFEPEGFIDFNSSSPGQASFSQKEKGGYCTQTLIDAIWQMSSAAGVGWPDIFDALDAKLREAMEKEGLSRFRIQQKVFSWVTLPAKRGEKWTLREDRWSKPIGQPKPGDRIVEVNARRVDSEVQLHDYLEDACDPRNKSLLHFTLDNDETVELDVSRLVLTFVDGKDGSTFYLITNPAFALKLGYTFEPSDQGVVVQSVDEGAPGARCSFFK